MECPKCGLEIDDKALVCPNCKKVLKLVCPICKTVNEQNTCKKCGYVIINKCNNCGKINQTFSKKCKKCGFDTEKSVIMNESNSDEFAMITLEFPNMSEMKNLLGSVKLFNKFKINLEKILFGYTKSKGLRCQLTNKTYVIRCNRDYTFTSSVATAMQTIVDILNSITAMNCKLTKKKNATLRCNIFVLKRSIEDDPYNLDSGYNISLLSQSTKNKEDKILTTFQVLTDDRVSDAIGADFNLSPLNSVMVKDEMVMFYEVDFKDYVKVEFPPDEEEDEIKIPNFVQNMLIEQDKLDGVALNKLEKPEDFDAFYDVDTINFEEIQCEFIKTENTDVLFHITNKFQNMPKGILAIKTADIYKPYSLKVLSSAAETGKFNNIITITCYDEMKYSPYSFFRDLVSAIFEYTVSQKLFYQNDFSMFASVDPNGLIKDLITLQKREAEDFEDTRYVYFNIFLTLLQIIPKTLIYIEDFDKIDASSYDVMKYLFEAFEDLDISFLLSFKDDFTLHKDCHFLLNKPYYTEISLKPVTFEKLIEDNKIYFKDVLNDFYFHRVAKYACGSSLYVDFAIQYLCESGVYEADEESVRMINPKTIIIPSNLDKLIARRLNLLQDDADSMKFLTSIVLLGTRIDRATVETLEYENVDEIIEKLSNMGYMYEFNNCYYFPNYNLLRKNLLSTISKIYLNQIAQELFEKVFNDGMPSPVKAYLYSLLHDSDNELAQWQELSAINLSLGDFSSYQNSTAKILELLDKNTDPEKAEAIEDYKKQIYQDIAKNLYMPEKCQVLAGNTLSSIEKNCDTDKVIELCNKMIADAVECGNYHHALELIHKVLSIMPSSSLNPADENFNTYFFIMSILHIQILFNIGALADCIDIGYKVFSVISEQTMGYLKPDYMSQEEFLNLVINSACYIALANILLLSGNVGEFCNILKNELSFIPKSFDIFIALEAMIHGVMPDLPEYEPDNIVTVFVCSLINAFKVFDGNYEAFAANVYKAKKIAKYNNLYIFELFSDLMIAYSYMKLDNYKKAESIIFKIIKTADQNGMTTLLYAAWYVMAELHIKQNKFDVAFGIINNSLIQLERNSSAGEYLLMLFKYSMYKVMMFQNQYDRAEICIKHAQYIAGKYNIRFDFDTDVNDYTVVEDASS